MADSPKTREVKLHNRERGPRSFHDSDGTPHVLRPGERFEGEVLDADVEALDFLIADDDETAVAAPAPGGEPDRQLTDLPDLEGKSKAELLAIAEAEGYNTINVDASDDELRDAITHARERNNALQEDLQDLNKKGLKSLQDIARKEKVVFETDDNKSQIAQKIAEARAASGEK